MPDHSSDPDFRTVIRLGWVSLLNDIGSETIARLVPFYVSGVLGASMAVVGTIEGIAETTSTLLKPVFGRLSDKNNGKKAFVLTGYLISSLARPLLALAASPLLVGFLRAADRFGKAVRVAPRDALIANSGNKLKQGKKFHSRMEGPLHCLARSLFNRHFDYLFWSFRFSGFYQKKGSLGFSENPTIADFETIFHLCCSLWTS
jgi:MFS family permease